MLPPHDCLPFYPAVLRKTVGRERVVSPSVAPDRPHTMRGMRAYSILFAVSLALAGLIGTASAQDAATDAPAHTATPERGWFFYHDPRSEEHTSELQSLMRISFAVFFLKT